MGGAGTRTRTRWLRALLGLAAVAAIAVGLWYAHRRGWWGPASAWVQQQLQGQGPAKSESGDMGMNMPGMDMGSTGGKPSPNPFSRIFCPLD